MPKASPTLRTKMDAATSKTAWSTAVKTDLGATLRLRCFRDANGGADPYATGTEFLNCAIAGPLTLNAATGAIESLGALSNVTLHTSANLATGSSCLRIEGNGLYLQYTLGLTGSGKDFTVAANIAPGSGFAFSPSASLVPPTALPISDAGGGGGGGSTPTPVGSTIATLSITNDDSVTATGGFIAPMFGHPFKKGDIPSGYYPMFELTDSTFVPCTMFNQTTWSDGSLKFASFLIRLPNSVAAGASVSVRIKATTTAPGSSSRSLSDLSSGSADLNVTVVGADQLSGTWVSRLNQGVIDADDIVLFGDGPVGKVWRIRQQFMQSGANHGQLEAYWYVAALQNAAGGLYGIRHLARVSQPWYNVDTPAKSFRSFSSMTLNNGAGLIRECVQKHAVTATVQANGVYINATGHNLTRLRLIRFTASTMPTGMAANTSYSVDNVTSGSFSTRDINTYADKTFGTNGSADLTIQALVAIPQFSSVYTAGASGKWDFTQAGGSAAVDPATRIVHDKVYWQTTGIVPTYQNLTVTTQDAFPYEPNYMGPVVSAMNATGERPDIGVMPDWHVKHLLSQTAAAEQTVRITGLAAGNLPIQYYNATTRTVVPVNAGSYVGMPTADPLFRAHPDYDTGFTVAASGPKLIGQDANDFSHRPALTYYAYLMTGEPQMLDMLLETGWLSVATEYTPTSTITTVSQAGRNVIVNGTTYKGVPGMYGSLRESAWATRDMAVAAALCPDNAPQCASYKTYFADVVNTNFAALKNYFDNVAPAYQKQAGFVLFGNEFAFTDVWMQSYYIQAVAMASKMTENANAFEHLNLVTKWPEHIYTNCGLFYVPSFETMVRLTKDTGFISSASQLMFYGVSVDYSSTTNVLTYNSGGTGYVVAAGDAIMFDDGGRNGIAPSGLALQTRYYAVNVSGNTFQLAASAGGAPIALGSTGSCTAFYRAVSGPNTGSISTDTGADSTNSGVVGALRLAKAAGATVNAAFVDTLDAQNTAANYADRPKYRFADHF